MSGAPSASPGLPPLLAYPERRWQEPGALDRVGSALAAAFRSRATFGRAARFAPVVDAAEALAPSMRQLSDTALREAARMAGASLRRERSATPAASARVLAPVCEAASRVLGQRPFPPQVLAAHACAQGMMVEMATGEGKTLAAGVAATLVALTGTPVHLLTVNAYLATRDAAFATPLYQFFGLACGLVTDDVPPALRREAYRCPITVAVNKEVAFDYMRDRMAMGRARDNARRKTAALAGPAGAAPLLRGLYHAIVDEADSVLIDEARTPLVLSMQIDGPARSPAVFDRALELCGSLQEGVHFLLVRSERHAVLLPAGQARLGTLCAGAETAPWDVAGEREQLVRQALAALHLLLRDEHYLVREGRAGIIDEFTGRVLPDRTWSDGLHELIERKEGLDLSPLRQDNARMTYQRFARRYRCLSGLSGTLQEVAAELSSVYSARVVRVPTYRPDRKTLRPTAGHVDAEAKWRAVVDRVAELHAEGIPVLIGARTLAASERASAALDRAGLPHAVLNAAQDAAEAAVVAAAGRPGAITVATNMAGRGTDIRIGDAVADAGGLRVIVSEAHEAGRIDRQLIGRCGRQGQKGEAVIHVALDDALLLRYCAAGERLIASLLARASGGRSIVWAAKRAQRRSERLHTLMRREMLRVDTWIEDAIAFAGSPE